MRKQVDIFSTLLSYSFMHIHKIQKQKHADFLNQNRKDPITGDLIVEGDEIVFCQECKSVFLKDTWEYLEGKHCNSSETLINFPIQKVLELRVLQDANSLLFPIKGTENEDFDNFGDKLDDHFWKKVKVNIRIDSQTQKTIASNNTISVSKNYTIYAIMGITVFVCIITGIIVDFSSKGYIFLVALTVAALFLPLYFTENSGAGSFNQNFSFFNIRSALLHFKENGIFIYFDESKSAYSVEYTDITQLIFSAQTIAICTQNGHQNTFRLTGFSVEQVENIIHLVYKLSSSTLVIFKNQSATIRKQVKIMETTYKNIWME